MGRKIGKYFFGWLDLSRDLFGYSKWYRDSTRVSWLPSYFRVISFTLSGNVEGLEIRHGIF